MIEQDLLFSMDIGTRTVVGIVGRHDGEKFEILAHEVEEHKERAMYDGQVHDIELVARAAQRVKEKLENKLGTTLKRVAIAAAGRSLKTCKVFIERESDPNTEIDNELISSLEIEGIQQAQREIEKAQDEEDTSYYCVGYAVVNYYLNGSVIGNLQGHKGKKIGMEVLATFLPRVVVDSLYSVMSRVGLEVVSMTLEPIAAMNVSIHSNLRLLNIALVDIGAGTSDIALTKSGTVFAFAMAPVAGDEITEQIAENYLLDFDTAEKVKISLNKQSSVAFQDIMGLDYEKSTEEILETVDPTIKMLAQEIANKIMEFNGKAPSAVFLIGGGSQIPRLPGYIAEYLKLPVERVGVRKTDIIRDVEIKNQKLVGPEFITPIGIAVTAHMNRQKDFLQVTVNDKSVKLFNSKALTVSDALILVGFNPRNLIGRRGDAVTFTLNGKAETVRGEPGEAAKIFVNGAKSGLDKSILNGDRIIVDPAIDGKPAAVYIKDYMSTAAEKQIYIDGKLYTIKPFAKINGITAQPEDTIRSGDEVLIQCMENIENLSNIFDIPYDNTVFYINGKRASKDYVIRNGDIISFETQIAEVPKQSVEVTESPPDKLSDGGFNEVRLTLNGKPLKIREKKEEFIFIDVFNYINIDLTKKTGRVIMLLNGNNANYMDPLKDGDKVEIRWEE